MPGRSDRSQLQEKLAQLEADAAAIRRALAILDGDAAASVAKRGPAMLQKAIAARHEAHHATNGNGAGPEHAAPVTRRGVPAAPGGFTAQKLARRAATAALLAGFDPHEPRRVPAGKKIGVLVQHGLLKRKGAGYVRTAKPFVVDSRQAQ